MLVLFYLTLDDDRKRVACVNYIVGETVKQQHNRRVFLYVLLLVFRLPTNTDSQIDPAAEVARSNSRVFSASFRSMRSSCQYRSISTSHQGQCLEMQGRFFGCWRVDRLPASIVMHSNSFRSLTSL